MRWFCIGDVHGDFKKLHALLTFLEDNGFNPAVDKLVQLGDKNDRGPDTFEVFEYFKCHLELYPLNTHLIMGNHELMLQAAAHPVSMPWGSMDGNMADAFWIPSNGGPATLASYEGATGLRGVRGLGNMLELCGHDKFLKQHELLVETDDYIFCHAPQKKYVSKDWRLSRQGLTWTHGPHNEKWVEDNLGGKIAVHGHIHGLSYKGGGKYTVQRVRRHGNTFLVDTGAGCADPAPLSCLVLPDMTVYNSDKEIYSLATQEEIETKRAGNLSTPAPS